MSDEDEDEDEDEEEDETTERPGVTAATAERSARFFSLFSFCHIFLVEFPHKHTKHKTQTCIQFFSTDSLYVPTITPHVLACSSRTSGSMFCICNGVGSSR